VKGDDVLSLPNASYDTPGSVTFVGSVEDPVVQQLTALLTLERSFQMPHKRFDSWHQPICQLGIDIIYKCMVKITKNNEDQQIRLTKLVKTALTNFV
jgi:hypothetical protein